MKRKICVLILSIAASWNVNAHPQLGQSLGSIQAQYGPVVETIECHLHFPKIHQERFVFKYAPNFLAQVVIENNRATFVVISKVKDLPWTAREVNSVLVAYLPLIEVSHDGPVECFYPAQLSTEAPWMGKSWETFSSIAALVELDDDEVPVGKAPDGGYNYQPVLRLMERDYWNEHRK
jgi:hypothetical protein